MKTETNSKQETLDTDLLQRARELCAEADRNGHATICEGSVWLSSSNNMMTIQEEHSLNEESLYAKFEFSAHPYWLELTDAAPQPINGPEDTDLLDVLICEN
ncbi:hypothetical protein D3C78_1273530 [compost metagenome]